MNTTPSDLSKWQTFLHHIVFALPFLKLDYRHIVISGETLRRRYETPGHGVHQRGGSELVAPVAVEETHYAAFTLQHGHVHIEIHPIDALQLKRDVVLDDFGNVPWYAHRWLRSFGFACKGV